MMECFPREVRGLNEVEQEQVWVISHNTDLAPGTSLLVSASSLCLWAGSGSPRECVALVRGVEKVNLIPQ